MVLFEGGAQMMSGSVIAAAAAAAMAIAVGMAGVVVI